MTGDTITHQRPVLRKHRSVAMALFTAVLFITGCSDPGDYVGEDPTVENKNAQQKFDILMQRPNIGEVVQNYNEMQDRIVEQIAKKLPGIEFRLREERSSGGGCGTGYEEIDSWTAVSRTLPSRQGEGALSEEGWNEALKIVTSVAGDYGFGGLQVFQDKPGNHDVAMHDDYSASLTFGSAVNTVIHVYTGCHLTSEAKQRGSLPPTPTY